MLTHPVTAKKYRTVPIGYSAADIAELRPMLQNYLACGSHSDQTIDFFGLNSYEWCGYASYETSGYSNLQAMAANYSGESDSPLWMMNNADSDSPHILFGNRLHRP